MVDTTPIPDIEVPPVIIHTVNFSMPDRDAQPILRIEPIMPGRAERSGHCKMRFNVNTNGAPYDVRAIYCSQALFERNSVRATLKFKYKPKIQDGIPVNMTGVETVIRYKLTDENGNLIPE